jgi:hypothetical protein
MKKIIVIALLTAFSSSGVLASTFNIAIHDSKNKALSETKTVSLKNYKPVSIKDYVSHKYTSALYSGSSGGGSQKAYVNNGYALTIERHNDKLIINVLHRNVTMPKNGDTYQSGNVLSLGIPTEVVTQHKKILSIPSFGKNVKFYCKHGVSVTVSFVN